MSIPGLLILLTVMSVVGRRVLQIIVVLGVLGGIGGSRVVRGAVIAARENVYFEAARAVGSSQWRTLLRHLLPNIAPVLIAIYSINIGAVVISEASLSFLGFGLPTTVPSWGGLLSREGRQYMEIAPRLAVWPGLSLTTRRALKSHRMRMTSTPFLSSSRLGKSLFRVAHSGLAKRRCSLSKTCASSKGWRVQRGTDPPG